MKRTETSHIFVLPENSHLPSGGNLYNSRLLQALQGLGFSYEALTLTAAEVRMSRGQPTCYWLDSLHLGSSERLLGRMATGSKLFLIVHHLPSLEPDLTTGQKARERSREQRTFQKLAGFLVTSSFTKNILKEKGVHSVPILTVPPALSIAPSRRREIVTGFKGLMVAHLIQRKGVLEFLKSLGGHLSAEDFFSLTIAGRSDIEPAYSQKCLSTIENLPLLKKTIRYLGVISPASVKGFYEQSSVFISASKMETFGMALQEAYAFRLPILAVAAEDAAQRFARAESVHFYPSVSELTAASTELIRHPERLENMQEHAPQNRAEDDYTWEEAARLFLKQVMESKLC